jgi:hypothetical protein
MFPAQTSTGESSRKDGRKGKESRKHRQKCSEMDPGVSYNIMLDYSKDGKGSSRKEKESISSFHRKK